MTHVKTLYTKTLFGALFASAVAVSAPGASAAVVDFTAGPVGAEAQLTGSVVGGATYVMTGFNVAPNNNQAYDGGATPSGSIADQLAFTTDGYGIGNDEITTTRRLVQSITLTFSKSVYIYGFAALDLFQDLSDITGEVMTMTTAGGAVFDLAFDAGVSGGYAETAFVTRTKSVTFTVSASNDDVGQADGALAAIDVAAVPVPAAGLMLLGGLGGLAALRRRKKSA